MQGLYQLALRRDTPHFLKLLFDTLITIRITWGKATAKPQMTL
jgi:hypothetical protein